MAGSLYVAGGRGRGARSLRSVEMLDRRQPSWIRRAPMPEARDWPMASRLGDSTLCVCGGYGDARETGQ